MRKSDWGLLALNAFAAFMSFVAVADGGDPDTAGTAFIFVAAALIANSVVHIRRARQRDDSPRRRVADQEMDAATVLDIDARLEALERAQHDAVDAARWRALVESGQVTAPASDTPTPAASGTGAAMRNGR